MGKYDEEIEGEKRDSFTIGQNNLLERKRIADSVKEKLSNKRLESLGKFQLFKAIQHKYFLSWISKWFYKVTSDWWLLKQLIVTVDIYVKSWYLAVDYTVDYAGRIQIFSQKKLHFDKERELGIGTLLLSISIQHIGFLKWFAFFSTLFTSI